MNERNPKNAPGPFYVVKDCLRCGAPPAEAPDLIRLDDDGEEGCYFHRQPETPDEVDAAIRAMDVSCVGACRYDGNDPAILRRLAEDGAAALCDHPLLDQPLVRRNHAYFALAADEDALILATRIVDALQAVWKSGVPLDAPSGDADRARLSFAPNTSKWARAYRLDLARGPDRSREPRTIYRDPAPARTWLLVDEDGLARLWLHELLVTMGAVDIRWFSREEWQKGGTGRARPY